MGYTDSKLMEFMDNMDSGSKDIDDLGNAVRGANVNMQKFSGSIISMGANIGIALIAMAAIAGIKKLWDDFNVTVEECDQKIENINGTIKDLNSELESLYAFENKTSVEERRINQLERELELQEELLKIETKRKYENLIGTDFSDNFDDESWKHRLKEEGNAHNQESFANYSRHVDLNTDQLREIDEQIALYEKLIEDGEEKYTKAQLTQFEQTLERYKKQREGILSEQTTLQEELTQKSSEYLAEYQKGLEMQESGLISGGDLTDLKNKTEEWKKYYEASLDYSENIQKQQGNFDFWDSLDDHTFFMDYEDQIMELVQSERPLKEITDELAASYPELSSYMEENEVTASDLVIHYQALVEKQAKLNEEVREFSPATITDSVKQIANQLEPQFTALGDAYTKIFTADGFTNKNIGHEMFSNIQSTFENISDELGVEFDTNAVDDFLDVLADVKESAGELGEADIQNAFNELATVWFHGTDTLDKLNAETANSIELQLADMGVKNANAIVTDALAANELYLAETGEYLADATHEEIIAFLTEEAVLAQCSDAMLLFYLQKATANGLTLNTGADVQQLINLMEQAGYTGASLQALYEIEKLIAEKEKAYQEGNMLAVENYNMLIESRMANFNKTVESEYQSHWKLDVEYPDTSSASDAGKESADAYLEAYEKEYEKLGKLRDQGKISEKEYLDALKALYEKYFAGREKYADKYAEAEREYLEGSLSLMESAISGITTLIDRKIDAINDAKDAALEALEEERDAQVEALESQKEAIEAQQDAIDDQIKVYDKQINSIEKEIDAIREANEERQRENDLAKEKYELQRLMNQRTTLVYTSDKGFVYRPDENAIRKQQQNVEDKETDIRIAQYEKEISYLEERQEKLEEQKDILAEQADLIDKQIDAVNEHYDKLIEQTEKMYDSMIESLEKQKSQWEELIAFKEVAEAYSPIQQVFGDLGYTVQDVMDGNGQAFEDFKAKYISLLSDMNSNASFQEGLAYAVGDASDKLGVLDEAIGKTSETLSTLADSVPDLSPISGEFEKISTTSEGAATGVGEVADAVSTIAENTSGLDSLNNLPDSETVKGLATEFGTLATNLEAISKALGLSEEGAIGSLVSQLQTITSMEIATEGGLVEYFNNLADAIDKATMALTGQSSGGTGEKGNGKTLGSQTGEAGSSEGGANTFADAIDEATSNGKAKIEEIAHAFHEEGNPASVSGAIGEVITKLGNPDAEEEGTFTTALQKHLEFATNPDMGIPYETTLFTELKNVIVTAQEALEKIQKALEEMDGKTFEVEFNVSGNGASLGTGGLSNMGNKTTSLAMAKGGSIKKPETVLVSEYNQPETIVRKDGSYEITDQPTLVDLNPGDVVYNEKETKALLRGRALAGGTQDYSYLKSYDPKLFELFSKQMYSKFEPNLNCIRDSITEINRQFENTGKVQNISNSGDVHYEYTITINCPNVTNTSGAEEIARVLKKEFQGMSLQAHQKMHTR